MLAAGIDEDRDPRGPVASLTNRRRWTRVVGDALLAGVAALGADKAATNILLIVTAAGASGWASAIATLRPGSSEPTAHRHQAHQRPRRASIMDTTIDRHRHLE
jgi:hypothetical protein